MIEEHASLLVSTYSADLSTGVSYLLFVSVTDECVILLVPCFSEDCSIFTVVLKECVILLVTSFSCHSFICIYSGVQRMCNFTGDKFFCRCICKVTISCDIRRMCIFTGIQFFCICVYRVVISCIFIALTDECVILLALSFSEDCSVAPSFSEDWSFVECVFLPFPVFLHFEN
jgi:hypothetical protein